MTLYALRPNPDTGARDEDAEVLSQSKYGWQFLEQAITLWRLVDPGRADEIEAIKDRVAVSASEADEELCFGLEDLRSLVRLLDGVEEAIVSAGIVDKEWRVPADRLEELARRVPAMDLETERSLDDKTHALGEIMINASSIRNFLHNAATAGGVVVLG